MIHNKRDIIVIGASAGGVKAIESLISTLPEDLPAAIFVVVHISPESPGLLPNILQRASKLKIQNSIKDGEPIQLGHIYVAPPDHHLLLEKGRVRLSHGPFENRARPAIDPLFRSAAQVYGPRVIGAILTGNLDDGTAGLQAVKNSGATTVIQKPEDAEYPDMPRNALDLVKPDYLVPLAEMGPLLVELVNQRPKNREGNRNSKRLKIETDIAEMKKAGNEMEHLGKPSVFACPECHGVLWEMKEGGGMARFRCRVGHAYSMENLRAAMSESMEDALWSAMRAMEEKVSLLRRMAKEARQLKHELTARRFEQKYRELETADRSIRTLLLKLDRETEH